MTGFFKTLDIGGLDLHADINRARGKVPHRIIMEHVDRGELGAKTGKGFYEWTQESVATIQSRLEMELLRLLKRDYDEGVL